MGHERFSDQIRAAVDASGMSRYAVCKAIGLSQSAMSRFMSGKQGLSLAVIDDLADLLGLAVAKKSEEKKGKG